MKLMTDRGTGRNLGLQYYRTLQEVYLLTINPQDWWKPNLSCAHGLPSTSSSKHKPHYSLSYNPEFRLPYLTVEDDYARLRSFVRARETLHTSNTPTLSTKIPRSKLARFRRTTDRFLESEDIIEGIAWSPWIASSPYSFLARSALHFHELH